MVRLVWVGFIGLILMFQSCQRNAPLSWDTKVIAPVIYGSMGIDDLVNDSLISVEADSSLTLAFSDTLYSLKVSDLLDISDTTIEEAFVIPVPSINVSPGSQFVNDATDVTFGGIDAQLTQVIIQEAFIDWELRSPITESTIYTYTIPSATLNGVPFQEVINVPPGSPANPTVLSGTFDLAGYTLDLTGTNGNQVNTLQTQITVQTSTTANPVTVTNQDTIYASNTLRDLVPEFARGYFGQETFSEVDPNAPFDGINLIQSGMIDIDSIGVKLNIHNGIGVDLRFMMNSLTSVNGASTVALSHNFIGSTINIDRAINTGNSFTSTDHIIDLNTINSNIDVFAENLPKGIGYDIDFELNPLGNVSNGNDFIYHNSSLDLLIDGEFPLSFIAQNLILQDTFEIDVQDPEQGSRVKRGTINLIAENGFPLDAEALILLFDEAGNISDTLVTNGIVLAGQVDSNNKVVAPTGSVMSFTANEEQTAMIYSSDRIAVRAIFNTPSSGGHYKIYDHYKLDIKITADVVYTIVNE